MKVYKLTDQNMQTHYGCQWTLGVEKTTDGSGELCSSGWLHAYTDPLLAVLLNPIHADIDNPRMFIAEASGKSKSDHGLKVGYTSMKLVEEMPVPDVTSERRVRFAILCAKEVRRNKKWNAWANKWLSGKDRSIESALTTASAASYADAAATYADAAATASYATASYAAASYAAASYAAASAASTTDAAAAAAAASAATTASHASYADIDLIALAHKAMEE